MEAVIGQDGKIELPERLMRRYGLVPGKKILISDTGRGADIQIESPPTKISDSLYVVGGLGTSYQWDAMVYLLVGDSSLILIDCGTSMGFPKIIENIKNFGFDPNNVKNIVLTHAHFDHFEGGHLWQKEFGSKVLINPIGKEIIENRNDEKTAAFIFGQEHKPFQIDEIIDFDKELKLDNFSFKPIHLPGHTPDNTGFNVIIDDKKFCFTADVCGAFNRKWNSNVKEEKRSIEKLMKLDIDILCHGHRYFSKDLIPPLLENWKALCEDEQFAYFLARKHQK